MIDCDEIKEEPIDLDDKENVESQKKDQWHLENQRLRVQLRDALSETKELREKLKQALSDQGNEDDFQTRKSLEAEVKVMAEDVERLQDDLDACMADRKGLMAEVESFRNSRARLQREFRWRREDKEALTAIASSFRKVESITEREANLLRATQEVIVVKVDGKESSDDVWWLLHEIESLKLEKISLEEKAEENARHARILQVDLNRCMADKAIYKALARSSLTGKFSLQQSLLQCHLEKEQLRTMLARYRLDVEMLDSKVRRHEADKKYAETMSALLKARLEAALGRQFLDCHDYCESIIVLMVPHVA